MKEIIGTGLFGDAISWGWNVFKGGVERVASVFTSVVDRYLGNNRIWTAAKNYGRTAWSIVKRYGNSAVSYVKQYGVVNTVRRAVDTINTKLKFAGQKTYSTVNNFLQNQYSKIDKSIARNWNHIIETSLGLAELGFGIWTIPARYLSGPVGIGIILKGEGDILVSLRNWFLPDDYWQYFSYHNFWPNYKTYHRINNNTHTIDTIEVPIKDGKEDWDNAVYIHAQNGAITLI